VGGRFKPVESSDGAAAKEVAGGLARHQIEVRKVLTRVLPVVIDVVQLHERLKIVLSVVTDRLVRPGREFAQRQFAVQEESESGLKPARSALVPRRSPIPSSPRAAITAGSTS
jgi:hypothetical protein